MYCFEGDRYDNMRSPPRNRPFFQSLAKSFIKWYERLWDWCTSKKIKLIFIKIILINPSASCLFVVNDRVYEKYDHLCTIFWFPHSKWNYCWWAIVSFYYLQILTTQNESLYQLHSIFMLFDAKWVWLWKMRIRYVKKIDMFINSYEQSYQFITNKFNSLNIIE